MADGNEDRRHGAARIRAFLFDAEGSDREVDAASLGDHVADDRHLLWVDVDLTDGRVPHEVGEALHLAEATVDRLQAAPVRPHVEDFEEYFHLNVRSVGEAEDTEPIEVDCVVGRNWVLTSHRDGSDLIEPFLQPIRGETELGRVEGPVFLALLLDWVLSGYFRSIEHLEARLDELDESLIAGDVEEDPEGPLLGRLVGLRRDVTLLRRTLSVHREVFATLTQPEFDKVSETDSAQRFLPLADRMEKALGGIDNARVMVMSSLDVLMTRTAQRTNDVMKILTVINAVLLPALVAAAILGMNFQQSFFDRAELFWVVVFLMVALGASILAFARHRRWI